MSCGSSELRMSAPDLRKPSFCIPTGDATNGFDLPLSPASRSDGASASALLMLVPSRPQCPRETSRCRQLPIAAVFEWATADDVASMLEAGIRGRILRGESIEKFSDDKDPRQCL
jgi:hypothetical protein